MSQNIQTSTLSLPKETWIKMQTPDTEASNFRHDLTTILVNNGDVFNKFIVKVNKKHDAVHIEFETKNTKSIGNLQKAVGTTLMQWYGAQHILYEDAKTKAISSTPHNSTLSGTLIVQGITYKSEGE